MKHKEQSTSCVYAKHYNYDYYSRNGKQFVSAIKNDIDPQHRLESSQWTDTLNTMTRAMKHCMHITM